MVLISSLRYFVFTMILIKLNVTCLLFKTIIRSFKHHKILNLYKVKHSYTNMANPNNDWVNRNDEIIIDKINTKSVSEPKNISLFDKLYQQDDTDDQADMNYSISKQSLRDISESYHFSLAYLGDFLMQMGCTTPIDIDTSIDNMLTGEQIYSLLQALTSLDAYESNSEYDSASMQELSEELGISRKKLLKMCANENINLPFGYNTILHTSIVEQLRKLSEYNEDEEEEDDDFIDADVF